MINKDIEKYERKKLYKKLDELEKTDPKLAEEYLRKIDPESADMYAEARSGWDKYDTFIIMFLALMNMSADGPAILYILFLFIPKLRRKMFKN